MSDARRHLRPVESLPAEAIGLRVVNGDGELIGDFTEALRALEDQLAGAESEVRSWRTKHANLKRDKEAEMRRHELFPKITELWSYWQRVCRHPLSVMDVKHFDLIRPFLEKYGETMVRRAIDGAGFDPYTDTQKNGAIQRYDRWPTIFKNTTTFEVHVNKAPRRRRA